MRSVHRIGANSKSISRNAHNTSNTRNKSMAGASVSWFSSPVYCSLRLKMIELSPNHSIVKLNRVTKSHLSKSKSRKSNMIYRFGIFVAYPKHKKNGISYEEVTNNQIRSYMEESDSLDKILVSEISKRVELAMTKLEVQEKVPVLVPFGEN